MFELSIKDFIKTLTNIFKSSPTSIIFIIAGLIFAISMIINIKRKKTLGWPLYIIGWIFIIVFIIVKYNNYLLNLFDNLINNIFSQILFPNLGTYIIIIITSNIIYLYTALKKDKKTYEKIINSIFFIMIMFLMIYTLEQIIENKLNVYNIDIYKNQKILILVETTTILFVIWTIFLISKKIIKKLINLSNIKIEKTKQKDKTTSIIDVQSSNNITQKTKNQTTIEIKNVDGNNVTKPIQNNSSNTIQANNQIQNTLNIPQTPLNPIQNNSSNTIQANNQIQNTLNIPQTPLNPIQNVTTHEMPNNINNQVSNNHYQQSKPITQNTIDKQTQIPEVFNSLPINEKDNIKINHINKNIFTNIQNKK